MCSGTEYSSLKFWSLVASHSCSCGCLSCWHWLSKNRLQLRRRPEVRVWGGSAASTVADKALFVGCSTAYSNRTFFSRSCELHGNSQTAIVRTVSLAVVSTSEPFERLSVEVAAVCGNCQRWVSVRTEIPAHSFLLVIVVTFFICLSHVPIE